MCSTLIKIRRESELNVAALTRDSLDKFNKTRYAEILRDCRNNLVIKGTTLEEDYHLTKKYVIMRPTSSKKSVCVFGI